MADVSSEVAYLQSLPSVRERCSKVFELAESNQLDYWDVNLSKEADVVDFTCDLIKRDFGDNYASIRPHGRWGHFLAGGKDRIQPLLDQWDEQRVSQMEQARRLVDCFVVSVLLDAGAGPDWRYVERGSTEQGSGRSEGLAVASLDMVKSGMFSGVPDKQPFRVDATGLSKVTVQAISDAMQVSEANPMVGIEGRARLLVQLGKVLSDPANAAYFAGNADDDEEESASSPRPGNMVDYLRNHPKAVMTPSPSRLPIAIPLGVLWQVLIQGLGGVWPPSRTKLGGVPLGDVWPCESLRRTVGKDSDALVPFHKLSQWLNYSLIEIFTTILGWKFTDTDVATGLPEYRNGGLLIDFGLLTVRPQAVLKSLSQDAGRTLSTSSSSSSSSNDNPIDPLSLPPLPASHSAIVEFRAVTVIMLDRIAAGIRKKLGADLTLPQVLEAATWKGGREIAKQKRKDGGPPINVLLDGTVF